MEKIKNRDEYLKSFPNFGKNVKLDENLKKKLREHQYFRDYMPIIEQYSEETQKMFILLEFTQKRKSCDAIIDILRELGQKKAADELQEYNTSKVTLNILNLSYDIEIPLNRAKIPIVGSLHYSMIKNPRGKFIIINNELDVDRERQRFEYLFKELYFTGQTYTELKAKEIENKLLTLSEDKSLKEDEALIVMIISHGEDEKVLGIDACRQRNVDQKDNNDVIKISRIVDIFSKANCRHLDRKPKIFIFDCCREKVQNPNVVTTSWVTEKKENKSLSDQNVALYKTERENDIIKLEFEFADQKWVNENMDTFVIYSCSEGHLSHYSGGMSAFGHSFSHAIAQYACEEGLQNVLNRTCSLMVQFKEFSMFSAPELRIQCARRDLHFNVGVYEKKKSK